VDRLGAVQIDTLQMVARAQYITLWSRHGSYDPSLFDRLASDPTAQGLRRLVHAACLLPSTNTVTRCPSSASCAQRAPLVY